MRTDVAALAAAVIAVSLGLLITEGRYGVESLIVGITSVSLVIGYAYGGERHRFRQSVAIACVMGLAAIPLIGAVIDMTGILRGTGCTGTCLKDDRLLIAWAAVAAVALIGDRYLSR